MNMIGRCVAQTARNVTRRTQRLRIGTDIGYIHSRGLTMVKPPSEPSKAQFVQERIHVDATGQFASGHNPEPINPQPDNIDANSGLDSESPDHEQHEHLLRTARERNQLDERDPATDIGMSDANGNITTIGGLPSQQHYDELMREAVMSIERGDPEMSGGTADGNLHFKDVPVQNGQNGEKAEKRGETIGGEDARQGGAVGKSKDQDSSGGTAVDYSK